MTIPATEAPNAKAACGSCRFIATAERTMATGPKTIGKKSSEAAAHANAPQTKLADLPPPGSP